jgi:exopolyphosphatase/guanosine-5'-triphosphate,3'-diphosphate pyrophosphatase
LGYFCSHYRQFSMRKIRAFIDLGTNTFHLLIAALENGNSEIIFSTKEIVGLGAGGINQGEILDDAMERGLTCLREFSKLCQQHQAEQVNAYGTSALRNASNSHLFIDLVNQETGIAIEIIGGDREAELIQLGISSSVQNIDEPYLIMDIGGGSTEFILVAKGIAIMKKSFEVGVQRLLSAFYSEDPITESSYRSLQKYLEEFLQTLARFKEHNPKMLVGASGTFTTLLRMYAAENGITESSETPVPTEFFRAIFNKLLTLPRERRLLLPGMSAPRVDLIVVGSSLVEHVIDYFEFDSFFVSGNGLKEGAMLLASKGKL